MSHPSKKDLDKELNKIFSYHKIDSADLGKIEMANKGTVWKKLAILFFAAGLLLSLIWGGFLLLGHSTAQGDDIKITIDGPQELAPMKEYDFTATLENVGTLGLVRVAFSLDTTDQFFVTASDPTLDVHQGLEIGNLAKKEKRVIHFRGLFLAKEGDTALMNVIATYHPENFNATFEASGQYSAKMIEGLVTGSVDGPDKLLSGDEGTFTVSYARKDMSTSSDNLAISIDAPADFIVTTSTVQPSRDKIWPIGFKKNETDGQAVFTGTFSSEASGDRQITFLIGQIRDNKFFPTKAMIVPLQVLGSEVNIDLALNGTSSANLSNPVSMRFGDLLSYSIDVASASKEVLKNMRVILHVTAEPQVNGETVVMWPSATQSPDANVAANQVMWTSDVVPSFKNFKPDTHEHLEGNVHLRPGPFAISFADYRMKVWVEVNLDAVGKIVKKRSILSKVANIVIQSDTAFSDEARYFDTSGVALSTGPLPPKVGEQTTYRIFWRMSNSLHQLSHVTISAPLGEHTVLTGKNLIPSGVFSYDSASKMATWSLDQWPASLKNMEINFELGLTPTAGDAGNMPTLLGPATMTATDVTTGATINLAAPALSTNIPNDSFAGGKSTVTP